MVSLCATAAFASLAAGCTSDDASITVDNQSQSDIVDIRVAAVDDPDFGPNLLDSALQPGDTLTIVVACDTYDVQLTDETDTTCLLHAVDLCLNDSVWTITESDLDACADGFFKSRHPNGLQVHVKNALVSRAPAKTTSL
ncbi:MAG TPA: hypothetical protein VFP84_36600 [Kofleriaceae bacterium]|nr:hypothetical protein [Kofleriaceae bacterium]